MPSTNDNPTTEWRITLPLLYGPGTIGHENVGARQGHYVEAPSPLEACVRLLQRLAGEMRGCQRVFDVQPWSPRPGAARRVDLTSDALVLS